MFKFLLNIGISHRDKHSKICGKLKFEHILARMACILNKWLVISTSRAHIVIGLITG